jgi:hypothetical protein
MIINTVADLDEALDGGKYTSVGGYPVYYITCDGAALSYDTVKEEYDTIKEAVADWEADSSVPCDGWRVVAVDINWEDPELYDDHTSERIESAYAEDDAEDDDP